MHRILFVCHGNICRSPMCEFDTHPGTQRKLREMGIPFTRRAARLIRREDYDAYDVIVAMDEENMRDLHRLTHGDPAGKCHLLLSFAGEEREVDDPWYSGNFDATYRDVLKGCTALLNLSCNHI